MDIKLSQNILSYQDSQAKTVVVWILFLPIEEWGNAGSQQWSSGKTSIYHRIFIKVLRDKMRVHYDGFSLRKQEIPIEVFSGKLYTHIVTSVKIFWALLYVDLLLSHCHHFTRSGALKTEVSTTLWPSWHTSEHPMNSSSLGQKSHTGWKMLALHEPVRYIMMRRTRKQTRALNLLV